MTLMTFMDGEKEGVRSQGLRYHLATQHLLLQVTFLLAFYLFQLDPPALTHCSSLEIEISQSILSNEECLGIHATIQSHRQ